MTLSKSLMHGPKFPRKAPCTASISNIFWAKVASIHYIKNDLYQLG